MADPKSFFAEVDHEQCRRVGDPLDCGVVVVVVAVAAGESASSAGSVIAAGLAAGCRSASRAASRSLRAGSSSRCPCPWLPRPGYGRRMSLRQGACRCWELRLDRQRNCPGHLRASEIERLTGRPSNPEKVS